MRKNEAKMKQKCYKNTNMYRQMTIPVCVCVDLNKIITLNITNLTRCKTTRKKEPKSLVLACTIKIYIHIYTKKVIFFNRTQKEKQSHSAKEKRNIVIIEIRTE